MRLNTYELPCGITQFSVRGYFIPVSGALSLRYLATGEHKPSVDVLQEGYDLAVRVRFPPIAPSDLVMRVLDTSTQCLVGAPDILAAQLATPADLAAFPSMDFHTNPAEHCWSLENERGQSATVFHTPRLVTDDLAVLREAALAGVGIVQLPTIMVWKDVQAGRLMHSAAVDTPCRPCACGYSITQRRYASSAGLA